MIFEQESRHFSFQKHKPPVLKHIMMNIIVNYETNLVLQREKYSIWMIHDDLIQSDETPKNANAYQYR